MERGDCAEGAWRLVAKLLTKFEWATVETSQLSMTSMGQYLLDCALNMDEAVGYLPILFKI